MRFVAFYWVVLVLAAVGYYHHDAIARRLDCPEPERVVETHVEFGWDGGCPVGWEDISGRIDGDPFERICALPPKDW